MRAIGKVGANDHTQGAAAALTRAWQRSGMWPKVSRNCAQQELLGLIELCAGASASSTASASPGGNSQEVRRINKHLVCDRKRVRPRTV